MGLDRIQHAVIEELQAELAKHKLTYTRERPTKPGLYLYWHPYAKAWWTMMVVEENGRLYIDSPDYMNGNLFADAWLDDKDFVPDSWWVHLPAIPEPTLNYFSILGFWGFKI